MQPLSNQRPRKREFALVWIVSLALSIPMYFLFELAYIKDPLYQDNWIMKPYCSAPKSHNISQTMTDFSVYYLSKSLFQFLIPLVILTISYR